MRDVIEDALKLLVYKKLFRLVFYIPVLLMLALDLLQVRRRQA